MRPVRKVIKKHDKDISKYNYFSSLKIELNTSIKISQSHPGNYIKIWNNYSIFVRLYSVIKYFNFDDLIMVLSRFRKIYITPSSPSKTWHTVIWIREPFKFFRFADCFFFVVLILHGFELLIEIFHRIWELQRTFAIVHQKILMLHSMAYSI